MGTRKITLAVRLLLLLVPVGIGVLMLLLSANANSKGQSSQPVTPVLTATPYASSPTPAKPESWLPAISAEQAQKNQLAAELDHLLREQTGVVIAQGENPTAVNPYVRSYQIEEVSLNRMVQFAVSGPNLCYCDEVSLVPPKRAQGRKLITIDHFWRLTVKGGPFRIGANFWYIFAGDTLLTIEHMSSESMSSIVYEKDTLAEGASLRTSYGPEGFVVVATPPSETPLTIHYNTQ